MKISNYPNFKKWMAFTLPILAMCVIIACSDDDKKDNLITPDSLAVTNFSPSKGQTGTEITVIGTGFSAVSNENTVTLGTTPVTLNMAEAGKLKFDVPEGASSGKISVTVGTETITSSATFTVEVPNPVPLITGFSPVEGEWGDHITITGTGFSETDNIVTINGRYAETMNREGNQITVQIGDNTRTGKIVVTNTYDESGESEDDFTVFHGKWAQVADFGGGPTRRATAFNLNGLGYVTNGLENELVNTEVWSYDATTNVWSQINDFSGTSIYWGVGFVIADTPYVGTGTTNAMKYSSFYSYDADSDSWANDDNLIGGVRSGSTAFSIGDYGYVGMGTDGQNYFKDFYRFDPSQPEGSRWSKLLDLPDTSRFYAVGFTIGNKGYLGTGLGNDPFQRLNDFWEYDPSTQQWSEMAPVGGENGEGRSSGLGFSINGKGYTGLGRGDSNSYLSDFWEYDPDANIWIKVANFKGAPRAFSSVFISNGKAYIVGGQGEEYYSDVWVFDPGN